MGSQSTYMVVFLNGEREVGWRETNREKQSSQFCTRERERDRERESFARERGREREGALAERDRDREREGALAERTVYHSVGTKLTKFTLCRIFTNDVIQIHAIFCSVL